MGVSGDPKVSVILPVYNGLPHIEKTLLTVFAQTHRPFEIIVVDDGSVDGTDKFLQKFSERIKLKRIPNGGVANARNTGLSMASGDWVSFIDHDDLWFKNKLERELKAALKYPEVGFVCSNYFVRVAYYGNRLFKHYEGLRNRMNMNFDAVMDKDAFELLLRENFVGTCSAVLIKKEVIQKAGLFDREHVVCEDYHYWLRCARYTRFIALSEPAFYKKTHQTNLSNDLIRIYQYNRRILRQIGDSESQFISSAGLGKILHLSIASSGWALGDAYAREKKTFEAVAAYGQSFLEQPSFSGAARLGIKSLKSIVKRFRG